MLDWHRVLFLDDDITGMGRRQVRNAIAALDTGVRSTEVLGWAFDHFPDNSVPCHAYRLAGGRQDTFIGGGALLVRLGEGLPHFPRAYNEDWLFLFPLLARRRNLVRLAGLLRQMPFDPFHSPLDARRQEGGDVLAEGLYRLLHRRHPVSQARTQDYWRGVLVMRRKWLLAVRTTLVGQLADGTFGPGGRDEVARACAALDAVLTMEGVAEEWPDRLAGWVDQWLTDGRTWARYLRRLPPRRSVAAALDHLGIEAAAGAAAVRPGIPPAPPAVTSGVPPAVTRAGRQVVMRVMRGVTPLAADVLRRHTREEACSVARRPSRAADRAP